MNVTAAAIVIGLAFGSAPALAQNAGSPKPATTAAMSTQAQAAKKPAAKKPRVAATSSVAKPADDKPTGSTRRKGKPAEKAAAAIPAAFTAMPEAERLAIQADLAWLGDYDATANGDPAARTIEAIKSYQRRHGAKDTGVLTDDERAALAAAVEDSEDAVGWRVIDDAATGARFGLPTKVVPKAGMARTGSRWTSGHGQIQVETLRLVEASLPALFDDERRSSRQRSFDYSMLGPDSFIISGMQGLKKFIMRVQARGSELRGITILYDQATEGTMAPVALAMADTFQGFPDPNSAPPLGAKRGVEYATAIVVSSPGYLVTLARVTDECQSISVPGFGHAERIAEDKSSDLALLRLYGARNLTPAAFAGSDNNADDVTLVGVADPLAQAGDAGVTRTPVHLTPQGLDPVPKLGFSGAAAVDPQGRFAGIVELKSPVVAGPTAAGPQAALIPAATVRAFLGKQGIAPATDRAAIEQSIVRVICVRN